MSQSGKGVVMDQAPEADPAPAWRGYRAIMLSRRGEQRYPPSTGGHRHINTINGVPATTFEARGYCLAGGAPRPELFDYRFLGNFWELSGLKLQIIDIIGVPKGIRTPVTAVKEGAIPQFTNFDGHLRTA
jgi:hypothetical protein